LNWNVFDRDEVFPEYATESKRVDYSLRILDSNKVFIEAKRVSEDLGNHTRQLLNYSFQEGVSLAILTNGISWWFYLPLNEHNWEHRKFLTIELYEQDANDIANRLTEFLLRENVASGESVESALKIFKSKQRNSKIQKTLPKALHKIVSDPDELFIELLTETTEKLCGYRPNLEVVEKFVKDNYSNVLIDPTKIPIPRKQNGQSKPLTNAPQYSDGEKFILTYKGISAIGVKVGKGIIIKKGSQASCNILESLKNHYIKHRQKLIDTDILKKDGTHLIFSSDYKFESFSAAASIICGSSINGLKAFNKM